MYRKESLFPISTMTSIAMMAFKTEDLVRNGIDTEFEDRIRNRLKKEIETDLKIQIKKEIEDEIRSELKKELRSEIETELRLVLNNETGKITHRFSLEIENLKREMTQDTSQGWCVLEK
jgi:hypothetical protein